MEILWNRFCMVVAPYSSHNIQLNTWLKLNATTRKLPYTELDHWAISHTTGSLQLQVRIISRLFHMGRSFIGQNKHFELGLETNWQSGQDENYTFKPSHLSKQPGHWILFLTVILIYYLMWDSKAIPNTRQKKTGCIGNVYVCVCCLQRDTRIKARKAYFPWKRQTGFN